MKKIIHPRLGVIKYPSGITIVLPDAKNPELAFVPWDEKKYGKKIPKEYRDIWKKTFPHLHVRSTDVHTAVSLEYLNKVLLPSFRKEVNENIDSLVCCFGIILHDCGWSKLTPKQISWTFQGIKGSLDLGEKGKIAKELHLKEGFKLAKEIIKEFKLTPKQIKKILQIVRHHDFWGEEKKYFPEFDITIDADRIWSYTSESFWLDVIRKGKAPKINLDNLGRELDFYFQTESGKRLARKLLVERKMEVNKLYPE